MIHHDSDIFYDISNIVYEHNQRQAYYMLLDLN